MPNDHAGRYRLFWEALSGAMAVELVLEEMGLAYDRVPVDMANGEHRTDRYLALNPTGQVPALALPEGPVIGESAAIILTLGDRHPDDPLVPGPKSADRPVFLRWLIYMAASPYMTYVQFNHPERFLPGAETHAALIRNARDRLLSQFSILNDAIRDGPFFFGDRLSALDLYVFMLIEFYPEPDGLFQGRDRLRGLHAAVAARQSARNVLPRHR